MRRPCRSRDTARTGSRLGAVRTGGRVAAGRGKKPVAAMVDVEDGDIREVGRPDDRGDDERRRIRHLRVFSRLKRRPVSSSRGRPPPSGASCGNPRAQTHPVLRLQVGAERRRHDLAAAEEGAVKCASRDLRRLLTEVEYFISACRFEGTRRALHLKRASDRRAREFCLRPERGARDPYP